MALTKEEREHRKECYNKLYELVKEFGAWSVNCKDLGKKWRVPHRTVINWKVKCSKQIGQIDIKSVGRDVKNQMESNLRLAHRAVRLAGNKVNSRKNPTGDDIKVFGMMLKAYNDTVSKHTEFAERWGYKMIVAQKVEVSQESEAERLARIVKEMEDKKDEFKGEDGQEGEEESLEPSPEV